MNQTRNHRTGRAATVVLAASMVALGALPGGEQLVTHVAKGTFQVEMKPQSESGAEDGNTNLGRMSLDKVFQGDLEGVGTGEMLTAVTGTEGSAGYVAIERVTGSLHGRQGSFVFQHTGSMSGAGQALSITVVPDSGTGALTGLAGTFSLSIVDGEHFYEFEYSLPEQTP